MLPNELTKLYIEGKSHQTTKEGQYNLRTKTDVCFLDQSIALLSTKDAPLLH